MIVRKMLGVLFLGLGLSLSGCGVEESTAVREGDEHGHDGGEGDGHDDEADGGDEHADAEHTEDGGQNDAGDEPEPAVTNLAAPELTDIMVMGGLHVSWVNHQPDCDTVEGERKTETEAYQPSFSVGGTKTSYMDSTATQNLTYTYRARCKKGTELSAYSNEISGNPTQ